MEVDCCMMVELDAGSRRLEKPQRMSLLCFAFSCLASAPEPFSDLLFHPADSLFHPYACFPPGACSFEAPDMIIHLQCTGRGMSVLGKVVVVVVVVQTACEALGTVLEPLESGSTRWRLDEVAHTPDTRCHRIGS